MKSFLDVWYPSSRVQRPIASAMVPAKFKRHWIGRSVLHCVWFFFIFHILHVGKNNIYIYICINIYRYMYMCRSSM